MRFGVDLVRLNRAIDTSGLKAWWIADKVGLSDDGLRQRRSGYVQWKVEELHRLCYLLEIKVEDVLFETED